MMIPAVANPSPDALGGIERVSLRGMKPVTSATIVPLTGTNVKPKSSEIRLRIAIWNWWMRLTL